MDKETFFTRDRGFYKALLPIFLTIAMQNLVAYSVNMTDNLMLGSYSQTALSSAATVNQIFFVVQQLALGVGDGLTVLAAQYWGQRRLTPVRRLTGIALTLGAALGAAVTLACALFPLPLLRLFTVDAAILEASAAYLSLLKFSFLPFVLTSVLIAALRSVETVRISFAVSVVSLVINVAVNYSLIFGRFGFPELGVRGAAIGTLIARGVELAIVLVYLLRFDKKLRLFSENFLRPDPALRRDYFKVELPVMASQVLWAVSVPMQTAILGHLSAEAIAANSVATTFYQYLKVIVQAMSAACAVMIGVAVGRGDLARVRSDARTLSVLSVGVGAVLALALFLLRTPLLRLYRLTPETLALADQLLVVMSVVMLGMSYQMPVSMGVIRGGGDAKFTMYMNIISTWLIVMPLSFLSAFYWRWSVVAVVMVIQSDQIFKGLPVFLHFRKYKWIKKLTRA
ncbi:MAG: MATE family efflux transporter [Oscillospiraceae bacterium]|nr:MATE family efflux transporter [Oscillospiraceae bacterium]